MPDYLVEPNTDMDLLVPRSDHRSEGIPVICITNLTNKFIVLKPGKEIAMG